MIKLKYILFAGILFFAANAHAQYKLLDAFPNLPTFANVIELTHAYDGSNRFFAVQQRGIVYVFNNSPTVSTRKTFINLSSKVSQSGSETGLLGLAFHPNYETNRYFYAHFTFDSAAALWSRISRFTTSASNPDTALVNTEVIYLTLSQPELNHNGGKIAFGNDGFLYISFGDGGGAGDPGNRAQNRAVLLGKILRINIDIPSAGRQYSIPTTNPYYGNTQGWKEEIFAYGLRNMWKFNFDYPTNRIFGADVGQGAWEEIDLIENGNNYGWSCYEGNHFFNASRCTSVTSPTFPIWEYARGGSGGSVTGGHVYRGAFLPELYEKYIYADYIDGRVWALSYDGINPTTNMLLLDTTFLISSFGLDENYEIYVCRYSSTGRIFRISNPNVITLDLKLSLEGLYDPTLNRLNISDTIRIYLHSIASPNIIVDSATTVIDSLTLKAIAFFRNAPSGSYYISIKHRNSLETWSKAGGESLTRGDIETYDFTLSASQAFGNNEKFVDGFYHIYSGDVNQDGIVDASDLSLIDNDALNMVMGYVSTDLTGDYFVDASDLSIADNNVGAILIRP